MCGPGRWWQSAGRSGLRTSPRPSDGVSRAAHIPRAQRAAQSSALARLTLLEWDRIRCSQLLAHQLLEIPVVRPHVRWPRPRLRSVRSFGLGAGEEHPGEQHHGSTRHRCRRSTHPRKVADETHESRKEMGIPCRTCSEAWPPSNAHVQLQGAFSSKFVNLNLRYLTLGHNLMPVAPVCCNM